MAETHRIARPIELRNQHSNIDYQYGPYTSVAEACSSIPLIIRGVGKTVGILGTNNTILEYWFQGGIDDINLIKKIEKGEPGRDGKDGKDGERGSKGDTGAKGDQGIQGIQGIKGDKGDQGIQGIPGVKGDKGDRGAQGEQGIQGIKGDQGIPGVKGDPGKDGATGSRGEKGEKGDKGDQGIQGIQGIKGDKGDTGLQGLPGKDGKDGKDGTNGTNGSQGLPGKDGRDGITNIETFKEDILVSIKPGKSFGRWVDGDLIPAKGKTPMQVIIEALTEPKDTNPIYYGYTTELPENSADILRFENTTELEFTIHPDKEYNTLAFPTDEVTLVSVVSENQEPWTNYYSNKQSMVINEVDYSVWSMWTAIPIPIDAKVTFKKL